MIGGADRGNRTAVGPFKTSEQARGLCDELRLHVLNVSRTNILADNRRRNSLFSRGRGGEFLMQSVVGRLGVELRSLRKGRTKI